MYCVTYRSEMYGAKGYADSIPRYSEEPTRPIQLEFSGPSVANMAKKSGRANSPPIREPS
jgi:hypothetical protein